MDRPLNVFDVYRSYRDGYSEAASALKTTKTEAKVIFKDTIGLGEPPELAEKVRELELSYPDFASLKTHEERRNFLLKKIRETRKDAEEEEERLKRATIEYSAFRAALEWAKRGLTLERPESSSFRALRKAVNRGEAIYTFCNSRNDASTPRNYEREVFCEAEVLVVEHDWSSALAGSSEKADSVKLPYDVCAFEFKISGHQVIALATQFNDEVVFTATVLTDHGWLIPDIAMSLSSDWEFKEDQSDEAVYCRMLALIANQIRAICIALDSVVAKTEKVREPHTGKIGKNTYAQPLSYHVVRLAHRSARSLPRDAPSTGRKIRLHFRRGHWRHYETFKTWIRWTLVGDPELGFIEKHYRL